MDNRSSRRVSEAYSWVEDDNDMMRPQTQFQQQQYQQQYEQQYEQPEPLQHQEAPQAPQPIHTQLAEGELQRETAANNAAAQQAQQQKIEVDEQQLANALLETLQKLTRPQPALANIGAPPPPPPPPPSESYFARTPSTLVAPRTPRTPISGPRPMNRYMSTMSTVPGGTRGPPQTFAAPGENVTYVTYSRPHTRTYSEKSFATR